MQDVVHELKEAISTIADRVHNSQEWGSQYYTDERGYTLVDQLIEKIICITQPNRRLEPMSDKRIIITIDNLDADPSGKEWALCLGIAGRVFCEPALRQATMDAGAAYAIAAVIYKVRKEQGLV